MKIGFLHAGIVQGHQSGVFRYGKLLASAVAREEGVTVLESTVIFTEDQTKNRNDLIKSLHHLSGVDFIHLQFTNNIWDRIRNKQWLLAFLSAPRAKLIVTLHDTNNLDFVAKLKKELGLIHKRSPFQTMNNLLSIIQKYSFFIFLMFNASKVFVHTRRELTTLPFTFLWQRKFSLLPHFIEERQMKLSKAEAKKKLGLTSGPIVTVLGFIFGRKGYELLIKAIVDMPELSLVFAGGPARGCERYLEGLEKLAVEHNIRRRLRITGFLSDEEQDQYMAATDLAVLPYKFMSASGALSTWIASGQTMILAHHLPEIKDYNHISPGSIETFRPYTHKALGNKIRSMMEEILSGRSNSGILKLKEQLSLNCTSRSYLKIIRAIV